MRRTRYGIVGSLLALGAPAGLLCVRLRRRRLSIRSVSAEVRAEYETYAYSAASTALAFTVFGSVLGHYADRLALLATTEPLLSMKNQAAVEAARSPSWLISCWKDDCSVTADSKTSAPRKL